MSRESDYEYGDELSKFVASYLAANGLPGLELRANSRASRYVNQAAGDVVYSTHDDSVFLECKRNGAISKSSIENFRGHEYVVSERNTLDDPERIHVIPRLVLNKYVDRIVNGNPAKHIKPKGWSPLRCSKKPGIYLSDNTLRGIKAGRTLKQYIEENKEII